MPATQRIIDAVKAGDAAAVKGLLDSDRNLAKARTAEGVSVILLAVYQGHVEIAELLLKKATGLDIFEAAAVGDAKRVRALLDADSSLGNTFAPDGWTPLHLAAFFGREKAALALVEKGADLHTLSKNDDRNTPLHAAVVNRKANLVRMLLAAGADVNAKTGDGWTPLHLAVFAGNKELANMLLAHRADVNLRNGKGETALEIATAKGQREIANLLEQQKSSEETK